MKMSVLIVPGLVTPVVLMTAIQAQRRAGASAGGLVATMPFQLAIGTLVVGTTLSDTTAAQFGLHAATYLPAMVAYALAFAFGMRRGGVLLAVLAALSAYSAGIALVHTAPAAVSCAVGVVAVAIAIKVEQRHSGSVATSPGEARRAAVATVLLGTAAVLTVVVLVNVSGPAAGAFLAAIPVISTTLAVALVPHHGRAAAAGTMAGTIRGLPTYFVFALAVAGLSERITVFGASAVGLLCSAVTATVAWRLATAAS
jgi:hypothetical protein